MPTDCWVPSGSVRDAIAADRDLADSDILRVLRGLGATSLTSHPQGLDRQTGESGRMLSPGERQLITLARVLVLPSPVIVLDEPTAFLDLDRERVVCEALRPLAPTSTIILITHRLPPLALAERLLVIGNGTVMLDGPREQVLKRLSAGAPGRPQ